MRFSRQSVKLIPLRWISEQGQWLSTVESGRVTSAKYSGLDIITWTFERSDLRQGASRAGFYYLFDPQGTRDQERQRYVQSPGCLGAQNPHLRHLFRLARYRYLLRQLYGTEVRTITLATSQNILLPVNVAMRKTKNRSEIEIHLNGPLANR